MTKKQITIMAIALTIGALVAAIFLNKQPLTVNQTVGPEIQLRNATLTTHTLAHARQTINTPASQKLILDAMISNSGVVEFPTEGSLADMRNSVSQYKGVFRYKNIASAIARKHPKIFIPLVIQRLRELAHDTEILQLHNREVWQRPNGTYMQTYIAVLMSLIYDAYPEDRKRIINNNGIQLAHYSGEIIDHGFMNKGSASNSHNFDRIPHDIIGYPPFKDDPNADATFDKITKRRRIYLNNENIFNILDAMENYYKHRDKKNDPNPKQ